jgi:uncharacterized protein YeeX (DUF496 family)
MTTKQVEETVESVRDSRRALEAVSVKRTIDDRGRQVVHARQNVLLLINHSWLYLLSLLVLSILIINYYV